ncbi:unnamed protein product [Caenorhabditis auriculariae]|uniref:Uncharacterized protein n=1 Tax=Caenorhabditis auriculariae TaxID=2777116 RepID=A0A8S1GQU7_9PELO|nr:unnamed protein product [Caenorhabditis auriculariae]
MGVGEVGRPPGGRTDDVIAARILPSLDRLQPWMIPIAATGTTSTSDSEIDKHFVFESLCNFYPTTEILPSPIQPRKISVGDRLFEVRHPRPGEMIKEAVQMAVWPALPSSAAVIGPICQSACSYRRCPLVCHTGNRIKLYNWMIVFGIFALAANLDAFVA